MRPNRADQIARILVGLSFVGIVVFPAVYWFDADHYSSADWHIHARFHILWKTVLMTSLGAVGLFVALRRWEPSSLRRFLAWIPAAIWGAHIGSHVFMRLTVDVNPFPHHGGSEGGLTAADVSIGIALIIAVFGAALERQGSSG